MVTAQIRDIAIIIVALQSIVIGLLIAILIFQVWRLVKVIKEDIQPILEETRETVNTVRGTTQFVSESVTAPIIKGRGFVAGARRTAQVLGSDLPAILQVRSRPKQTKQ
ncbi:hypothetical protein KFU94_06270 [Chloroflexi bacterium TSY]|nr:hypothetical protein [Chloroflexi bacterium TSY]